jgi:hypothetical protein
MKNFDKDIRSRLYNHTEEYDVNAFDAIKKSITPPQKDNRRKVLFFFTSLIVLYFANNTFHNIDAPLKDAIVAVEQRSESLTPNPVTLEANVINSTTSSKEITNIKKVETSDILIKSVSTAQTSNLAKHPVESSGVVLNSNSTKDSESPLSKSINDIPEIITTIASNTSMSTDNAKEISKDQLAQNNQIENQVDLNDFEQEPVAVNSLPDCFSNEELTKTIETPKTKNILEFTTGANLNQTKLSSLGEEMSVYQQARQNSEQRIASYSAAAFAGVRLRNNMVIKTGVVYTNLRDKFTYNDPAKETTKQIRSVKYFYGSGNRLADSLVTVETVSTPGGVLVSTNNYTYIDIPIIAEINLFQKSRFGISWNPGIFVNAVFRPSGYIFDEDAKSLISLADDDVYKNRIGFSFHNGLSLKYKLSKSLELNLEPSFRFSPLNSTTDQAAINEAMRTSSLNLSVRYHY